METYVGKPKELVKCEGYFREIIDIINNSQTADLSVNRVNRLSKPHKQLEQTLEDFLKVGDIAIYWLNGNVNAFTIPASSLTIAQRRANGDFSKAKFHIALYENLVYDAGLNEGELMAVLLHELGHCFYTSSCMVSGEILATILDPISVLLAFVGQGVLKISNNIVDQMKRSVPGLYNIITKINHISLQFNYILNYLVFIPDLKSTIKGFIQNIRNPYFLFGKYGNERGADSFATKYGYGGELISALKKLSRPENVAAVQTLNKMGGFGDFMLDYHELLVELYGMITIDPHPNSDVRARSMIQKLKRDLNTGDYPPELKKDLEKEIARLEQIYSTINDNKSNIEIKKGWYNMVNCLLNGHSNLQEIFNAYYEQNEF